MFEWLKKIIFINGTEPAIDEDNLNKMQTNTEQAIQDVTKTIFSEDNLYNSTLTYKVGDIVVYEKKIYKCITAIEVAEEFNPTKWKEINLITELKSSGSGSSSSSSVVITTAEISENTNYQIPLNYIIGNNSLEIYYMGEKLVKDKHYIEVGTEGETSNIIQFYNWGQSVPIDRLIEFIVRGV